MPASPLPILLVEDEPAHAELAARAFAAEAAQFALNVAGSLAEARRQIDHTRPALIIADWVLPDGRGMELLEARPAGARVPLVLMTSQGNERVAVEAMKAGALDYIVKSETVLLDLPHTAERVLRDWDNLVRRQQAEAEIRRLNAELEQRVRERTAQLEAANRELEAFSYSVSHDLRAPLRAIDGFSRILIEDCSAELSDDARRYLANVRQAAQRMGGLIDDLLRLSRITRAELHQTTIHLDQLAREVIRDLQARQPGRRVAVEIQPGLTVQGDPNLLRIALENLLGNAWKFTVRQPAARIEFGARSQGGETVFHIRDNGAGFDMAYAHKLFGAFQRLHAAGDFDGTGIGLATVQRIVSRHGGRVWAEAAPDQGATFYFTLPLSEPA